jgi:hypothetical protein
VIINGTSKKVQLESSVYAIPSSFVTGFGSDTVITLKVSTGVEETSGGVNLKLSFSATPASSSS